MSLLTNYKLVWKRRRLLWRAFRARRDLARVSEPPPELAKDAILGVMCLRDEMGRLPYTLDYYRKLGVAHFCVVDNDSQDGTFDYLRNQTDVSLWHTKASYRDARFGLDWTNWLLMKFGHGHWCLTIDADELLVYAHHDRLDLAALTRWLDANGQLGFGAMMLELYPNGPIGAGQMPDNPLDLLEYFDAAPYRAVRQSPMQNLWLQGGVRERVFFQDNPRQSPTLNKVPLIRWNRRYAYVNSTHSLLPRKLNHLYDGPGGAMPSGVLLHTKFLPEVTQKAEEDTARRQHFHDPDQFTAYYQAVSTQPNMHNQQSQKYTGWHQLATLGLMTPGNFS